METIRLAVSGMYLCQNGYTMLIYKVNQNGKCLGKFKNASNKWVHVSYYVDGSCNHVYDGAREWDIVECIF